MRMNSDIYYSIMIVHYHDNRFPEALDAAKEVWKLSEPHTNNLVVQAQTAYVLGMILFSMIRDAEAWK